MPRRTFRPDCLGAGLEPRELLSGAGVSVQPAQVQSQPAVPNDLFHKNGVDGLKLHASFVNQLNDRLAASQTQATRTIQAFQVFVSSYGQLPVVPAHGSSGQTLSALIATLQSNVNFALGTNVIISSRLPPSQSRAPTVSPLAPKALIPFADAQIATLDSALAAAPPVVGSDGKLTLADPTTPVNTAINAIMNALAETSVHPNLFLDPGSFYLSPDVTFTISFSGSAPAKSSPGYFVRGPHGVLLPGAIVHPHVSF